MMTIGDPVLRLDQTMRAALATARACGLGPIADGGAPGDDGPEAWLAAASAALGLAPDLTLGGTARALDVVDCGLVEYCAGLAGRPARDRGMPPSWHFAGSMARRHLRAPSDMAISGPSPVGPGRGR